MYMGKHAGRHSLIIKSILTSWILFVHNFLFHLRSKFFRTLRTSNDVDGWQARSNRRAGKAKLPVFLLLELLTEEARTVDVNVRPVADNMALRCQRAVYRYVYINLYWSFSNYFTLVVFISPFCHIQNMPKYKILSRQKLYMNWFLKFILATSTTASSIRGSTTCEAAARPSRHPLPALGT